MIVIDYQVFIHPVNDRVVESSNRVQNWHSCRVSQNTPEGGEKLGIYEESCNLGSSIQSFPVRLNNALGQRKIVLAVFRVVTSIPPSFEHCHHWISYLGHVRSDRIHHHCIAESCTNLVIPICSKFFVPSVQDWQALNYGMFYFKVDKEHYYSQIKVLQ